MSARPRPAPLMIRLSTAVASVLLVTACGGSDGGSDSDSDAGSTGAAAEEPAADPCADLEGKVVTLVVGYSPGGGYDTYARMLAPALSEQLGAEVVVENQPGAGGLLALNNLRAGPKDGTQIAIMNGIGAGGAALAGAEGVQFELDELSYIGRLAGDAQLIVGAADGEYQDWQDVQESTGFQFGGTGPGASDYVTPALLISMLDLEGAELITGFDGSSEVEFALLQGEVDGMSGQVDSRRAAIENGDQVPLLVIDRERPDLAADTPTILELDLDEQQKELAEAHLDLLDIGRPIVGPADMEEDALTCLRTAFDAAVEDPDLLAEAEAQERPLNPLSGEELDELVDELVDAPESYITVLEDSF